MKVYLDNCSFNRPYDDHSHVTVRIESDAKMVLQDMIQNQEIELVWSFILEYENDKNPFNERRINIAKWRKLASIVVVQSASLDKLAEQLKTLGLKTKDALHIAAAITANCEYFITTDKGIIKKARLIENISIINPVEFFIKE